MLYIEGYRALVGLAERTEYSAAGAPAAGVIKSPDRNVVGQVLRISPRIFHDAPARSPQRKVNDGGRRHSGRLACKAGPQGGTTARRVLGDVTKRALPFKELIAGELARIEAQLVNEPSGPEREALERKRRRFETAFDTGNWDKPARPVQ